MKTSASKNPTTHFSLTAWADEPLGGLSPVKAALHLAVRFVLITVREFLHNGIPLRAGSLTYTVLLSLVPILAISTAVVKGMGGGDQLRKAAYAYVETLETGQEKAPESPAAESPPAGAALPSETLTTHLRQAVDTLFNYVDKTNFATLGTIGVAGILITVVMVLGNIEEAMNTIWKVHAGRSLLRKIADYITLLVLMPISINLAFAASAFLKSPALASKMDILIPFSWLQALLLKALPVLVIALTFTVMYMFFPNSKVKTLPAFIGAVFASVFWFTIQNIYISLQIGVANYNAIYGSFATLPLFLVWIYLGWIFFLTGAQVAYALQNIRTCQVLKKTSPPSLQLAAAFDIMDALYISFTADRQLTAAQLAAGLPTYPPRLIAEILAKLRSARLLHVSDSDKRLLPATPRDQYDGEKIVEMIFSAQAPDTEGGRKSLGAIQAAGAWCRSLNDKEEGEDTGTTDL